MLAEKNSNTRMTVSLKTPLSLFYPSYFFVSLFCSVHKTISTQSRQWAVQKIWPRGSILFWWVSCLSSLLDINVWNSFICKYMYNFIWSVFVWLILFYCFVRTSSNGIPEQLWSSDGGFGEEKNRLCRTPAVHNM